MYFWSKGLGKRSLHIACGTEKEGIEAGKVLLRGHTLPPLSWEYVMVMGKEDWLDFFELAFHPEILRYLLKPRRFFVAIRALLHLLLFLALYLLLLPFAFFLPRLEEKEVFPQELKRTPASRQAAGGGVTPSA